MSSQELPNGALGSHADRALLMAKGAGPAKVLCWIAIVYTWVIARMIQWRAFNKINPLPADMQLRFENLGLIGELRDQKDAAEDANIAKSRFIAAASHDLQGWTPEWCSHT